MKSLKRKKCDGARCQESPFFKPTVQRSAAGDASLEPPEVQRQEAPPAKEEEKKNPLAEGFKLTGGKLLEQEPLQKWAEPHLLNLKYTLWEKASTADKAAMLGFLGVNLGMAGMVFATNPQLRLALSDVNIGKLLTLIPNSPVEGFKYKLGEPGKPGTNFSADFTLKPLVEAMHKRGRGSALSGATFGLESNYDPGGKGFNLTGGKVGLDFFGGALKAEGKTFNELSPYPLMHRSDTPGEPASWVMQQYPGLPMIQRPGAQFMINADLLKLFPWLQKNF